MRLNKATNHAIRLLIACARSQGTLVKVAELSERLDLTQQNAFKVVHLLSRAGFVKATRGRYGGVQLARAASDIRVGDVVREMEALSSEAGSDTIAGHMAAGRSPLFDEAFEAFIQVLNQSSIADMARAQIPKSEATVQAAGPRSRKTVKAPARREPRRTSTATR